MKIKNAFKSAEGKAAILSFYNQLLGKWPFPHETLTVGTRLGDTFVVACGNKSAPPLVLLHGGGANTLMWLGDAVEYSRDFRVYIPDIPGEPGNSNDARFPLKGSAYADWLSDVLDGLGMQSTRLAGLSLGGWLALKFATSRPERVSRLVLLCPAGITPQKISYSLTVFFSRLMGERGMRKAYGKVNGEQPMPEVILKFQMLIRNHFNFRRDRIPLYSNRELERLTMPVELIVGKQDVIFNSEKSARRIKKRLPQAKVILLPGAGHTLINLASTINEFLAQGQEPAARPQALPF